MSLDERDCCELLVEMLFMGQLVDSNERWAYYKAFEGQFPTEEELVHLKGIIFPGSKHSVYDDSVSWMEPLRKLVKMVYEEHQHIKMVGVCFGH